MTLTKSLPIVINNFNRYKPVERLMLDLLLLGYNNIIILDNNSTYPRLQSWYERSGALNNPSKRKSVKLVRLEKNYGAHALFDSGYLKEQLSEEEYIIYTDPDIELNRHMPPNFVFYMAEKMHEYKEAKAGLALRIDNFPPDAYGHHYIDHESEFWKTELEKDIYRAPVDTTFCLLHKPIVHDLNAIRIAGDFTCKHLPWYAKFDKLDDEELFFVNYANTQSNFANHYRAWQKSQK